NPASSIRHGPGLWVPIPEQPTTTSAHPKTWQSLHDPNYGHTRIAPGVALQELEETQADLIRLAQELPQYQASANTFTKHIKKLKDFVTYSSGYIHGARSAPEKPYTVRPRLAQVRRIFGKYAEERNIHIDITVERDLIAPMVPVSLYNGIALNLYTNALKAVTAKTGEHQGTIAFRAWNDARWHYLEVSDTGIGIPAALHDRVFDPLFTTTKSPFTTAKSRNDPLGSGMGLGLSLVRRGAEAFGGSAELVQATSGFSTCIRVRLPIPAEEE
ncbi:MAG: HAMP domain-containing sensor histidine kinase, partial [Chloroflexi bacterium]|nr:HAMP domain-containing sensor histidine kinase [Chloroflexota bacterium]